jgi:lipid-binding SYLF domain-containing protein
MPLTRRLALALLPATAAALAFTAPAGAASRTELTRDGEAALRNLYALQPRTRTLGARARAILVFPRIVKVGVLLAGGQSGDGVLLVHGRPAGYYNLSAASFGPQIGGQAFGYALFLMNQAALDYLNKSDGWAIGTGPTVVVIDRGAAATLDSTTLTQDVYAVPFDQK